MITAAFTLAGFALLMIQILTVDTLRALREIRESVDHAFGHDARIYPDHTPN